MSGNVMEWVQDCWHDSYKGSPGDGSAWEEADGCDRSLRVSRSGSWNNYKSKLRSANRGWSLADLGSNYVGFRLAKDL